MNPFKSALLLLILLSTTIAKAEVRDWTSDVGTNTTAEFISFQNGAVTLRTTDGRMLDVPLERLSQEDQDYVQNISADTFLSDPTPEAVVDDVMEKMSLPALCAIVVLYGIAFISSIVLVFKSFQESFLWGLGYLFVPFVSLVFIFKFWDSAKKPFLVSLFSGILLVVVIVADSYISGGLDFSTSK